MSTENMFDDFGYSFTADDEVEEAEEEEPGLMPDKIAELKRIFNTFLDDPDMDTTVKTDQLGPALRAAWLNPTLAELNEWTTELEQNGEKEMIFEEYMDIVKKKMKTPEDLNAVRLAFKSLDVDGFGELTYEQLHKPLTTMGEVFTEEEMQEFFHYAHMKKKKGGVLEYDKFVLTFATD